MARPSAVVWILYARNVTSMDFRRISGEGSKGTEYWAKATTWNDGIDSKSDERLHLG